MSSQDEAAGVLRGKPSFLTTESYGLTLIGISACLYAMTGGFVKLATESGLPSTEVVFVRAVFEAACVVGAMFFFRETNHMKAPQNEAEEEDDEDDQEPSTSPPTRRLLIRVPLGNARIRPIVIARGAVGGCGFVLYFYTISALPLGDAVALLSLSPVVTLWASSLFGKDHPVRPLHILAAVFTVVGSFLIARPDFVFGTETVEPNTQSDDDDNIHTKSTYNSFGYVTAAMGTCTGAGVFLLMRKAGKSGAHTLQLLFSWVVFGLLFSILLGGVSSLSLIGNAPPWRLSCSWRIWAYLAVVCVLGSGAHFLLNFAGRHSHPGLASIVRSSGILWAYLLQMVLFDQIPTPLTFVGVLCVACSLVLVAMQKMRDAPTAVSQQEQQEKEEEQARLIHFPSQELKVLESPKDEIELQSPRGIL